MPRTRKLNIGIKSKKAVAKISQAKKKIKDLVDSKPKKIDDEVVEEEEIIYESQFDKVPEPPVEEKKEVVAEEKQDVDIDKFSRLLDERFNLYEQSKLKLREEKKKAAEERQNEKKKASEEKLKAAEARRAKNLADQRDHIDDIVRKTILQHDRSILIDKIQHAKILRASNLNF